MWNIKKMEKKRDPGMKTSGMKTVREEVKHKIDGIGGRFSTAERKKIANLKSKQ